nr:5-formyltetrahydrofolate cyclo-ligase [Marinobacter sp. X15-166B]
MPVTASLAASDDIPDRKLLRKQLRQRRRALSAAEQRRAARQLSHHLLHYRPLYRARHVAVYLPNDGEIDPGLYVAAARQRGVQFYLPVLHPFLHGRMVFCPYNDDTRLTPNRFGIPEPAFAERRFRPAWALHAVLLPLVGFDRFGERLGMGGGFYDRTFEFSRRLPGLSPKLIGLAHSHQQVDRLPAAPWDIPLHGVMTELGSVVTGGVQ